MVCIVSENMRYVFVRVCVLGCVSVCLCICVGMYVLQCECVYV